MALADNSLNCDVTALITNSLKVGMAQTPSRKAPRWSEKDLAQVEKLLPYCSPKVVGQMLGRSEDAIKIMRQRQKIKASSKSKGWLSANRVMRLLGMPDARPVIGWVIGRHPWHRSTTTHHLPRRRRGHPAAHRDRRR